MNKVAQFFIAGVIVVAAIKLFGFEKQLTERVIGGVRTGEPERILVAAALTVALGMVAVIAAQLFRKVG